MKAVGIIPARLASSRLPGKLLLSDTGKPLLQHTWEAACRAASLTEVIVATESPEILEVARGFGARCQLTGQHPSGTDRVAEVARRDCLEADIIVNIQGDEPETEPAHIDAVVGALVEPADVDMATLAAPIRDAALLHDSSCVKVVSNSRGNALYFSRAPIPYSRDALPEEIIAQQSPWRRHIGLYGYRRSFLLQFAQWPPSALESLEKLEQLRALEAGAIIRVITVECPTAGIDTPADYDRFVRRFRAFGK